MSYFLLLISFIGMTSALRWLTENITLTGEYSNHGDPHVLCSSGNWTSITLFIITNYLAHCATVKSYPGDSRYNSSIASLFALFFPSFGVIRAMNAIIRRSRFVRGELAQAARAVGKPYANQFNFRCELIVRLFISRAQ
jgi:hypothetical protein